MARCLMAWCLMAWCLMAWGLCLRWCLVPGA
jgi:hypothetical protein